MTFGDLEDVFTTGVAPGNDEAGFGFPCLDRPAMVVAGENEIGDFTWVNQSAVSNR